MFLQQQKSHLAKMAELPNPPKADLSGGFTVSQVAEKAERLKTGTLKSFFPLSFEL
jgi:hypothetical protein